MAITKERKQELIKEYTDWLGKSQALFITEYKGLTMGDLDGLRRKIRAAGGEFHVVKNTLGIQAFKEAGMDVNDDYFQGSTAVSFAFDDVPGIAKLMTETARTSDFLKIKGGYLGKQVMTVKEVQALAELPPLPVVRAQLLGVLQAPASKLVRTIAEPARSLAAVFKAYADHENAPAAAEQPAA